ncbi:MAG: hypothetical protein K8R74_11645 [Bacteroidales bacterium]|nr:hypothetical protein [Bacteroidales bacterium]
MILANFITIVKYGVNIFLAVMGYISFDDINQKLINNIEQNHSDIENVNYVESLQEGDYAFSEKLVDADQFYFNTEKDHPEVQITNQIDYLCEKEPVEFVGLMKNNFEVLENYLILESNSIKDFEILVLHENDKVEFEYLIKVVGTKNITQKVVNLSKTLHFSNFNSTY